MGTPRRSIAAVAVLSAAAFALPATGQAQAPPVNDNYLQSAPLNQPNSRLERRDTLRDVQNTFNASVQGDVFNPPQSGGPPELTSCGGAGYGKTVWYDIYPDVNGLIRLRANGYDTVLAVVPFNPNTARPRFDEALCSNASSGLAEEYLVKVKGGDSYSIQVGGVNGAGGALEFLFDFLADSDGDGVLNAEDRCDRLDGTQRNGGCPRPARGDASLRARPTANGIQLLGLTVRAPRRSRVVVRCSRGCRRYVKRARRRGRVRFGALRGRQLRAGTKLDIRITRRDSFGTFIRYRVLRGNFKKIERCMNPGSSRPRRSCG